MKTVIREMGYLAAAAMCLFLCPAYAVPGQLLDLYKTGRIVIEPDPSFGKSIDWENFFFDDRQDIAVSPDGSIFVAYQQENYILQFDRTGRPVKKLGRRGQGPGDFISPCDLSILDGRFLVVGEYALNRRLSLFNLDGTFHKLIKTRHATSSVTALKDNKVAYLSWLSVAPGTTTRQHTFLVLIIDAATGAEREVTRWTTTDDSIRVGPIAISSGDRTLGNILIARSAQGNLLVGNTTAARIDEYSPDGQKVRSFDLNMTPIPVTKKYIREYKRRMVREMKSESDYQTNPRYRDTADKFESVSIDHIFGEYLPLYKEMLVDAEGNILVFKTSECLDNCPHVFQVYSPEGKFVCKTELASEDFDISIDYRFKRICFTNDGIFCLFPLRGDELRTPRLIKVDLGGAARRRASNAGGSPMVFFALFDLIIFGAAGRIEGPKFAPQE
ncbi:MAG: 6-bladed beta-propeller [Candidatus Aminicenantes bacterium]|nr:6-bladed beta-propeller [Candidatus Aminicenantes bacterium]